MDEFAMPEFRDDHGRVMVWDSTSQSYVVKPDDGLPSPDRGHATGGDNDLFDPFQHTEEAGSPETEGIYASYDTEEFGEAEPVSKYQPGEQVVFRGGQGNGEVIQAEQWEGGWWYRVRKPDGNIVFAPEEACVLSDEPGGLTLGDLGIPPEGEDYYRTAAEWAPAGQVKCPNCENPTDQQACPVCGKDLTPEWNQEQSNEFMDVMPQHSDASEFTSWPVREPKRNRLNTDDSFSSETVSAYQAAVKLASFQITADEWDDLFSGATPLKTEIGKWLIDKGGNLHIDHGMHALHEQIAARDGLNYPGDVGALGSVYNDGSADTQRVFPGFHFDITSAQAQIGQAFGPVTLQPPVGQAGAQQKGHTFQPMEIHGGQWVIAPQLADRPITGVAWVKERPEGQSYQPNMILVAEHLQPEDFALWSRGVTAIITATGGLTSHAAYLASTEGIPVVVGIGPDYNKVETGNYLKVDPATQTITVMPGASGAMSPTDKKNVWDSYLQYQLQRGGNLKPEYFAHIDEELAWREANMPTLDSCPECHQPMMDQSGESVCHGCGHKQPIIQHNAAVLAPLGELALGGEAGGIAGGAAAGGGGVSGMGGLMQKALNGAAFRGGENTIGGGNAQGGGGDAGTAGDSQNFDSGAETQGVISSWQPEATWHWADDEVGRATQNRGDDSNPDTQTSSGSDQKEHGDSPEQLKDTEGLGGADESMAHEKQQGDPALQDKAMKAFHMNLPLVIEFANSDEPGMDNPILRALDELLEEAFPGYKDGHDELGAEDEHPVEEIHEEIHPEEKSEDESGEKPDEGDSKEDSKKEASVWHYAEFEDALADLPPVTSEQDPDAETPLGDLRYYDSLHHEAAAWAPAGMASPAMGGGYPQNNGDLNMMQQAPGGTCPACGQNHLPGTPCPTPTNQMAAPAATGGQVTPPQPQTVVTKWQLVSLDSGHVEDMARMEREEGREDSEDDSRYECGCGKGEGDPDYCQECHPKTSAVADPEFAFFTAAGEGEHHHVHEVEHKPEHHHEGPQHGDIDSTSTPWLDESGAPLMEGADYELKSSDYAIPDRVTIDRILPDKLVFTIHSGDVDYRDEISQEDLQTNGYSFAPVGANDAQVDSIDGFQPEAPIRPGQDAIPQQDDLSTPSTVVSHEEFAPISLDTYTGSFNGDAPDGRSWLMEGNSPGSVAVDPTLMAKLAGKGYSPREQREFIDESGTARNLDRLDLAGTHYVLDGINTDDALW